MMPKLLLLLLSTASLIGVTQGNAEIVSKKGKVRRQVRGTEHFGEYKYFYDASVTNPCETVFFLAVGTAMSVDDYSRISTQISTGNPIVTVVSDTNPGNIVKLQPGKYQGYYESIVPQIKTLIPACANTDDPVILVGGHSASGQAILDSFGDLSPPPSGFIGLDPFSMKGREIPADLPTLDWGFTRTTCAVTVEDAAMGAYEISSPEHRVLYRVENDKPSGITHCSFTDNGCFEPLCSANNGPGEEGDWVIPAIAVSIHKFANDVVNNQGKIKKSTFESIEVKEGKALLFVDAEQPGVVAEQPDYEPETVLAGAEL